MNIGKLIEKFPEILTREQKENIRYESSDAGIFTHFYKSNGEPHLGVFERVELRDEEIEVWECKICEHIEAVEE